MASHKALIDPMNLRQPFDEFLAEIRKVRCPKLFGHGSCQISQQKDDIVAIAELFLLLAAREDTAAFRVENTGGREHLHTFDDDGRCLFVKGLLPHHWRCQNVNVDLYWILRCADEDDVTRLRRQNKGGRALEAVLDVEDLAFENHDVDVLRHASGAEQRTRRAADDGVVSIAESLRQGFRGGRSNVWF